MVEGKRVEGIVGSHLVPHRVKLVTPTQPWREVRGGERATSQCNALKRTCTGMKKTLIQEIVPLLVTSRELVSSTRPC
jgi:hypothetical protein